jgi:hypothetical protein
MGVRVDEDDSNAVSNGGSLYTSPATTRLCHPPLTAVGKDLISFPFSGATNVKGGRHSEVIFHPA